jgi:putative FmdB family regulatory protein
MPTYEYKCQDCDCHFDEFQMIKDDALGEGDCPKCQGDVCRVISGGSGLIFHGSGFYITDHRSESYKKDAKADGK